MKMSESKRSTKTKPYAIYQSLCDAIQKAGFEHGRRDINFVVAETIGYGESTASGWKTRGIVPEVAIWATRHLLHQVSGGNTVMEEKPSITYEEVNDLILSAVADRSYDLAARLSTFASKMWPSKKGGVK